MKKFEYKIIPFERDSKWTTSPNLEATEVLLTGEGLAGWEAVSTFIYTKSNGVKGLCVLMKREVFSDDQSA